MAFNPSSALAKLLDAPIRAGTVVWLGLRPARRAAMLTPESVELDPEQGVVGDRYAGRSGGRQVTLIAEEQLMAVATYLGWATAVAPERLRRNVVTRGINLLALKERRFRLGEAVLEPTGECHPCSRMEEELGPGGYNALRGGGGITARVLHAGVVRLGDPIARLDAERSEQ